MWPSGSAASSLPLGPRLPASGDEYLDAICKEILRLRPVVFDVGRMALIEMRIVLREVLRRAELETTTAPAERIRVKGSSTSRTGAAESGCAR